MGYVSDFLTDKLQAQIAETLVDDTIARLRQRTHLLDRFMPIVTYESEDFLAYVTEKLAPIASVVAMDAEIPIVAHGEFRRVIGELARLALGYQFDGKTQKDMRKAMEEATYKNASVMSMTMTDGSMMKGVNDPLVKYLYGHVETLVQGHADWLTAMAWQVVQTGQINYTDPRTRVAFSIDYRRPNAPYNHFPAPLTQTGNTVDGTQNVWNDFANADGITLLENAQATYVLTNGFKPDAIAMSNTAINYLRRQQSTITKARQAIGVAQVGSVGYGMLNEIMIQNNLPPIVQFDELYQLETTFPGQTATLDPNIANARFLQENRFVFLKEGLGQQCLGQSEETMSLKKEDGMISGDSSAVTVRVYEKTKIPLLDIIEVTCVTLVSNY